MNYHNEKSEFKTLAVKAIEYTLAAAAFNEWEDNKLRERLASIFVWCEPKETEVFLKQSHPQYLKLFYAVVILK